MSRYNNVDDDFIVEKIRKKKGLETADKGNKKNHRRKGGAISKWNSDSTNRKK